MRHLLYPTLAAALIVTSACGSDSSTGPATASFAGTYSLKTVNSAPLPYTMPDDGSGTETIEILADSHTLTEDGKYSGVMQVRLSANEGQVVTNLTSAGTYALSGSTVTLTASEDPTDKATGTISGSNLTISVDGFVLVYQRSGS